MTPVSNIHSAIERYISLFYIPTRRRVPINTIIFLVKSYTIVTFTRTTVSFLVIQRYPQYDIILPTHSIYHIRGIRKLNLNTCHPR